jgi:hypothetical protein
LRMEIKRPDQHPLSSDEMTVQQCTEISIILFGLPLFLSLRQPNGLCKAARYTRGWNPPRQTRSEATFIRGQPRKIGGISYESPWAVRLFCDGVRKDSRGCSCNIWRLQKRGWDAWTHIDTLVEVNEEVYIMQQGNG